MTDNPYSTPQADTSGPHSHQSVNQQLIEKLSGTRPWVMLIAVMLYISAGFMVLAGVVMMVAGTAISGAANTAGVIGTGVMGFIYIVFALLYIFPAIYLSRYGSRINALINNPDENNLIDAIEQQRKFWKFAGIVTIIMLAFMVLVAIAAIAIPMMTTFG
ncbi:hypothetical protein KFE80_03595 [bacterium SCSIO 12696]|nr:hypothetical protein KFE80_03595 [bacterium SCSIO 12696]